MRVLVLLAVVRSITVEVDVPGRSAAEVEAAVVAPIEEALAGLGSLRSRARAGFAAVTVAGAEASAVAERVRTLKLPGQPPRLVTDPATEPVLRWLGASAEGAQRLAMVSGVARVDVCSAPDCVVYRDGAAVVLGEVRLLPGADPAPARALLGTQLLADEGPWRPWEAAGAERVAEASRGGIARWSRDAGRVERLGGPPAVEIVVSGGSSEAITAAVARAAAGPEVAAWGIEGATPGLILREDRVRCAVIWLRGRLDDAARRRIESVKLPAGVRVRF